jgi:DinB superfamily
MRNGDAVARRGIDLPLSPEQLQPIDPTDNSGEKGQGEGLLRLLYGLPAPSRTRPRRPRHTFWWLPRLAPSHRPGLRYDWRAMKWESVQQLLSSSSVELASAAERVPAEKWLTPRAEGKWSPAELLEHLNLAFDVMLRELSGGPGMQVRTRLWQRILLRLTMVPRILRGRGFPQGARAPKETRPVLTSVDQKTAIAGFRDRAARFEIAAAAAHQAGRVRLTHAYFGKASIKNSALLCARHIQHHRQQLG